MRRSWVMRAAAVLVVVAFGLGSLSSCAWSGSKTIYAKFNTTAGLFVGNDVGVLGVPVGKVTEVKPEGSYVLVTMEIDNDQPIPANAYAVVVSRSVATDRYVELAPVFHAGDQEIADGGTVGDLDRNKTPVEFDQVLSTIGKFADQISGSGQSKDAIQRFLTATSDALGGRGDLINQAITSLGSAVSGVSAQRDNATQTLVALDGLTAKLAGNQQTIREFVQQVSQATELLAAERKNFRDAISSATTMIDQVAQFAHDNRAQITKAVRQTNGVLATVKDKSPQVSEVLRLLPLATENIQKAINSDDRLVVRLELGALLGIGPLGGIIGSVCESLNKLQLCQSVGLGTLTDPGQLIGAIGNLLSGLGLGQ